MTSNMSAVVVHTQGGKIITFLFTGNSLALHTVQHDLKDHQSTATFMRLPWVCNDQETQRDYVRVWFNEGRNGLDHQYEVIS